MRMSKIVSDTTKKKISKGIIDYYKNNPKARINKSESMKGSKNPMFGKKRPEVGIKNKLLKTGIRLSDEHKRKCSLALKGKNKGIKNPSKRLEVRKKISASLKKKFKAGFNPWLGRKHSIETKKKISEIRKEKGLAKLEKNPRWMGGLSFEPYSLEFNENLKEKIRKRDSYICQICFNKSHLRNLSIHHIDYNKKNNDSNNLISLCISCHTKTNSKRLFWEKQLKRLIGRKNNVLYKSN